MDAVVTIASTTERPSAAEERRRWDFHWITSWEDVWAPGFRAYWQTVLKDSPNMHVFFHPALVRAWVDSVAEVYELEPRFIVARSDGDVSVFLPLVLVRMGWKDLWRRKLAPVGYMGFDYHDPLLIGPDTPDVWSSFWPAFEEELLGKWAGTYDDCSLWGMRYGCMPTNLTWSDLHEIEIGAKGPLNGNVSPCADLSTVRSIEEFMARHSANLRGDVGRRLRRMEELGGVTFRVFAAHEVDWAKKAIEDMLGAHARRWPMKWRLRSFYDNLVEQCLPAGLLHFSILQIAGIPASWHLGFVDERRFYYYLPAFSPTFAGYSPGKVHIRMCVADAIERGLAVFDFLRGDEAYKFQWSDFETQTFGLSWVNRRPQSCARLAWGEAVKPRLVWLRRRLRNQFRSIGQGG